MTVPTGPFPARLRHCHPGVTARSSAPQTACLNALAASAQGVREAARRPARHTVDGTSSAGLTQGVMSSVAEATWAAPARAGSALVSDDEPNVASFVGRALRAKGFQVDVA